MTTSSTGKNWMRRSCVASVPLQNRVGCTSGLRLCRSCLLHLPVLGRSVASSQSLRKDTGTSAFCGYHLMPWHALAANLLSKAPENSGSYQLCYHRLRALQRWPMAGQWPPSLLVPSAISDLRRGGCSFWNTTGSDVSLKLTSKWDKET